MFRISCDTSSKDQCVSPQESEISSEAGCKSASYFTNELLKCPLRRGSLSQELSNCHRHTFTHILRICSRTLDSTLTTLDSPHSLFVNQSSVLCLSSRAVSVLKSSLKRFLTHNLTTCLGLPPLRHSKLAVTNTH